MLANIKSRLGRGVLVPMLVFLVLSAIYLYAFPQPNVFYAAIVLLHAFVGILACIYLLIFLFRILRQASTMARFGWLVILASATLGVILIKVGTSRPEWKLVYAHIALALAGCGVVFADWVGRRGWSSPGLAK